MFSGAEHEKDRLVVEREDLMCLFRRLRLFWQPQKVYQRVSKGLNGFITDFVQMTFKHITTPEIANPAYKDGVCQSSEALLQQYLFL